MRCTNCKTTVRYGTILGSQPSKYADYSSHNPATKLAHVLARPLDPRYGHNPSPFTVTRWTIRGRTLITAAHAAAPLTLPAVLTGFAIAALGIEVPGKRRRLGHRAISVPVAGVISGNPRLLPATPTCTSAPMTAMPVD